MSNQPSITLEDGEKKRCTAGANLDRLNLDPSIIPGETNPSPSSDKISLLSLPWEIVTQIASHLSAHCIKHVLPEVCQALGRVGEDRLVWQLRAQKLSGPLTSFPVGPKEDFDWSKACLEMEQLIDFWTVREDTTDGPVEEEINKDLEAAAGGVDDENQVDENISAEMPNENLHDDGRHSPQQMVIDVCCPTSDAPSSPLEHIVLPSGHIADVNCVLLLGGEGAMCASGSRDRNVNLWDLRQGSRGKLTRTLGDKGFISTHRGWVWCLASDGPLLASGSFDSTVRLWDLGAGGAELNYYKCKAAVLCLSCDGDTVMAGSHDQKISIYDTRAADPLVKSLRHHSDAVLCLESNDQVILSGSKDQTVALYDRRAGKLLQKLQLSSYLLSMSCNGQEVWAGDNRGLVQTFSLQNGSLAHISQFNTHNAMITGIHSSPGTLYTCSSDKTVKVHLPCAPPKTLFTLQHQAGVNGLSVEADTLAIASADMNVEVWRPRC